MPAVFITATGTDIGKTFVAAGLARAFARAGDAKSRSLKPVVSGFDPGVRPRAIRRCCLRRIGRSAEARAHRRNRALALCRASLARHGGATRGSPSTSPRSSIFAGTSERAEDVLLIEGIGGLWFRSLERDRARSHRRSGDPAASRRRDLCRQSEPYAFGARRHASAQSASDGPCAQRIAAVRRVAPGDRR